MKINKVMALLDRTAKTFEDNIDKEAMELCKTFIKEQMEIDKGRERYDKEQQDEDSIYWMKVVNNIHP